MTECVLDKGFEQPVEYIHNLESFNMIECRPVFATKCLSHPSALSETVDQSPEFVRPAQLQTSTQSDSTQPQSFKSGVTEQSCSGAVFNRFMGKFECSSSSQAPDKTAKQKEKSSFDAATVANKEAAAYSMVSNQPVQDQFRVPSLVTFDCQELFESSSSKANNWRRRKRGDADSFSESHMVEQCNTGMSADVILPIQMFLPTAQQIRLSFHVLHQCWIATNMRGPSSSHGKRKTHSGVDSRGFQIESPSALYNQRPPSLIDCSVADIASCVKDSISVDPEVLCSWRLMLPAPQVLAFQLNTNGKGVFGSEVLRLSAQLDHHLSALFMLLSFFAQLDHPL
ncbi:hypothetical protein Tco_0869692 [Tanacetum coccineum]